MKKILIILFLGIGLNLTGQTVTDIDGNIYQTIKIGTQTWIQENLKVTKLNDGTEISLVTDNTDWGKHNFKNFCWYNHDENNKNTYGALYNWYTVNSGKLCPAGWHVPTDVEWSTLSSALGTEKNAGGKLKETGTTYWNEPNLGASNSSNFKARPGGYRNYDGKFSYAGNYGHWWTSTENATNLAWYRLLSNSDSSIYRGQYGDKVAGFSVRCIKDNLTSISKGKQTSFIKTKFHINPLTNKICCELDLTEENQLTILIYNSEGKNIFRLNNYIFPKGENNFEVAIKNLDKGLLICQIISKDFKETKKFFIQNI